ncbi:MAG TPA: T9SS type A sorting domain-containing protein [Luteibaculaceae bacterium]|nr:T9SS type A sorting domain-containing protein [Luteibaculaceae bacterium]
MKTLRILFAWTFGWASIGALHAQLNFRWEGHQSMPYQYLSQWDEQYPALNSVVSVPLGFSMSSFGFTTTQATVGAGNVGVEFGNRSFLYLIGVDRVPVLYDESQGSIKIKRFAQASDPYIIFEFDRVAFQDRPLEHMSYQMVLYRSGKITYHFGFNSLSSDHPSLTEGVFCMVVEDYYPPEEPGAVVAHSCVAPVGDPLNPELDPTCNFERRLIYPFANQLYVFQAGGLSAGLSESALGRMRISPNPLVQGMPLVIHNSEAAHYTLADPTGRVVAAGVVNRRGSEAEIHTDGISEGLYVLTLRSENQTLSVTRLAVVSK